GQIQILDARGKVGLGQSGVSFPGREDCLPLFETAFPLTGQAGIQFPGSGQSFLLAIVFAFVGVMDDEEIVADLGADFAERFGFLFGAIVLQFLFALFLLRLVLGEFFGHVGTAEQRFLVGLAAGSEHAVERVVILRRDRIKFVIVTAGAGDGEAHGAAA